MRHFHLLEGERLRAEIIGIVDEERTDVGADPNLALVVFGNIVEMVGTVDCAVLINDCRAEEPAVV